MAGNATMVKLTDVQTGESWVIDTRPDPLYRDDAWTTADGREVAIGDMAESHIANVIAFLRRRAGGLKRMAIRRMWADLSGPFAPGGDAAADAFDQSLNWLYEVEPIEWLDETPIICALKSELVLRNEPWGVL